MAEKQPYPPSNDYPQGQAVAPGHGAAPPPYLEDPPPYGAPPPPAFPYQSPTQAGTTTVIVQQVRVKPVAKAAPPKQSRGLFGSLMKEVDSAISSVTHNVNDFVGHNMTNAILEQFQTGNVIQLVSRTSGKSLQVVMSASGQPVVDGAGQTVGQPPFNTVWTVVAEGKNQIRLQNNNNYLTIINGQTMLVNMPPGSVQGIETKFQLHLIQGQFVIIESMKEPNKHIGVMPDGNLKPALSTGREMNSHFAVKLVYSPYAATGATAAPPAQPRSK